MVPRTVLSRVNTARPKAVLSVVKGNKGNAVKALAYWVWRPKHKILDHVSRNNGASMSFKRFDWPRKVNMYSVDLKNVVPQGGLKLGIDTILGNGRHTATIIIHGNHHSFFVQRISDVRFKPSGEEEKKDAEDPRNESGNPNEGKDSEVSSTEEPRINQEKDDNINITIPYQINSTNNINTASDGNNTNNVNVVSSTVNTVGSEVNVVELKTSTELPNDPNMPELKDILYLDDDEDVGAEADIKNLDTHIPVSPIPTTRIHKDHPVEQIIRDIYSTPLK
ncbi:hypothetical protein Tco_0561333 [Tanacetum coccineum]